MSLSSDLISQFAKVTTNNKKKTKTESTVYGKVVKYDGKTWIQIDGSDRLTPISTTTDVEDGERVTALVKDHTVTITGNISSPAARTDTVKEQGAKINEFDIIVSYKVSTEDLEAVNATIESLRAYTAKFDNMEAVNAEIEKLEAKFAELEYVKAEDVDILNAEIENLRATFGEFTDISTDDLEAINAEIDNLKGYTADFTYVSADVLQALKADIGELDVKKLDAEQADIRYAQIDFANIGEAAIKKLFTDSGIIRDLVVSEGHITGELVGVTIKGDLIEGGTVKADKLVVKGSDGIYYKLNMEAGVTSSEEVSEEELQNGLHGDVIVAHTITAEKINVDDLVAFDATIGGFNITKNSIYSGVKESVNNSTPGVYLDNSGQVAFGDSNNYLKYYRAADGKYKLEIAASSILFASGKTIEDVIEDVKEDFRSEIATVLRIESSRGTVFKNDNIATVLSVVLYHGSQRITDSTTMKQVFGNAAYLQWKWQRLDDDSFGVISSGDSRFGDGGFTFTLSPEDVDTKVTFMCELIV